MTLHNLKKSAVAKFLLFVMLLFAFYFNYKGATNSLTFDDAYMFTRYAKNILENHNFGWNAGERTYGCTSIAYTLFVTLMEVIFSGFNCGDATILKLSSFLWGMLAIIFIYRNLKMIAARSALKNFFFPELVVLIILFMPVFTFNLFNGMDTTMSLFANSLMIFLFLRYENRPSLINLVIAALSCYFIFFVRPDNCICMIFPALFLWNGERKKKSLLVVYAIVAFCLAIDSILKYAYFGYIIPLPFYVKSLGLFQGYLGIEKWNATQYLYDIFEPFICLIIMYLLFIERKSVRKSLPYWLPLTITYLYFFSVIEIMGTASRYYVPFIPFLITGIVVGLESSFPSDFKVRGLKISLIKKRILLILILFPVVRLSGYISDVYYSYKSKYAQANSKPFEQHFNVADTLPQMEWWHSIIAFDSLMKIVPKNTVVASSEDGFIGSDNIEMQVLDLSELHNNDILNKITLTSTIEKKQPDIIWLPHNDYAKERYEIYHSQKLLNDYDFYPYVLNYGIALKKSYVNYNEVVSFFDKLYGKNIFISEKLLSKS